MGALLRATGSFDSLNASMYRDQDTRRPFMVMTAYFDESGTHGAQSDLQ